MSKNKAKSALTALSVAMLLVACNGNDHDNPQPSNSVTLKTLTISPSLGKVLKAKVVLKNAANNAPIGEQNTGSTGKVTFTIPSTVSTVIAEVQGGNGAQYFDEATGQIVDLPTGSILRAATTVVANNSEIGVTALTEAAVKRAEALANGGSIIPQLNTAKAQIESAFGVTDILKAPTLVGSQQELAALGSSAAEQYALRLATLAKVAQQQLGASETAPALKVAQAIANDLADGDIDGSGNTGALPYDVATFASQYQAQALKLIQDFIASASQNGFDAAKLQALLTFVQSNPLTINVMPMLPVTVAEVSPAISPIASNITITGTGFATDRAKMQVMFANNVLADIVSISPTTMVVTVPQGAVKGQIKVTNLLSGGSAMSLLQFNPDNPPVVTPVAITGISQNTGVVGATVTITGTGFDADLFHMVVKFNNNIAAEIVSSSTTQLVVKVPAGAVTGAITVTNSLTNLSATTSNFTVQTGGGEPAATWTARSLPSSFIVDSITFGNGQFVVVGFGKGIYTSTNGISWTTQATANPNSPELKSVIYDGSQFITVGGTAFGSSAPPLIMTSPDGVNWTTRSWTVPQNQPETQLNDIAIAGGKLTAVGANGTIISSTDSGVTWSNESQINNNTTFISEFTGVTANALLRVAVGRNSAFKGGVISNSGSGWSVVASDMSDFFPRDVVWTGSQFVAVGGDSGNFGASAATMTSADGTNWTRHAVANAPASHVFRSVFWDGTKLYAGGDNGQTSRMMMSSSDGVTWTLEHQSTVNGQGVVAGIAGSSTVLVGVGGTKSITKAVVAP